MAIFFEDLSSVELHNDPDQIKRQKNATQTKVVSIDKTLAMAIINDYDVSLTTCTCRDYFVRRTPCKHMYRLAHELGVFILPGKFIQGIKPDEAKLIVSKTLSTDEKTVLHTVLYYHLYNNSCYVVESNDTVTQQLIQNGILETTHDLKTLGEQLLKSVLVKYVKNNSCAIKCNIKKADILFSINDKYPNVMDDILTRFSVIKPSEQYSPHARRIYNLLCRELGTSSENDFFNS